MDAAVQHSKRSTAIQVDDLRITYRGDPPVTALDGIALTVLPGRCLFILGESGSGKSTLGRSLLGLLPEADITGTISIDGRIMSQESDWRAVRWRNVSIALASGTAMNPVVRVGQQIAEPIRVHLGADAQEASRRAAELLAEVGLGAWAGDRFPHELSTGQRRLAMIAMALSCDSPTVVLDEPTSGLDPQTRTEMLAVLAGHRDRGRSLLVLSHDVAAARFLADDVMVLYRGWVAERGDARGLLDDPRNPYSFGLLNANPTLGSVKDLRGIRGNAPPPGELSIGCPFASRCTQVIDICTRQRPAELPVEGLDRSRRVACHRGGLVPVLELQSIAKDYVRRNGLRTERVPAVVDVSLTIRESEVLGLVGRNGAGKSTLAQIAAHLAEPDAGSVHLQGRDLAAVHGRDRKALRGRVQMLFPDPVEALSARLSIGEIVREPLDVQQVGNRADREEEVLQLLAQVGLPAAAMVSRHAHELSTGQLQRVALARALVLRPKLLVADEPVECLDPSERAKVLQLLKSLQVERGMSMLLISHDLSIVLRVADRVAVMDGGRVVESAPSTQLLQRPVHPVTRALLQASGADPSTWPEIASMNGHVPSVQAPTQLQAAPYEQKVSR